MRRFRAAGLDDVTAYPSFYGGKAMEAYFEPVAMSRLADGEKEAWLAAKATALADGNILHDAYGALCFGDQARLTSLIIR